MNKFLISTVFAFSALFFSLPAMADCSTRKCTMSGSNCLGEKKYEIECKKSRNKMKCKLTLNGQVTLEKEYDRKTRRQLRQEENERKAAGIVKGGGSSSRTLRINSNREILNKFKSVAAAQYVKCGSLGCQIMFRKQSGPTNPGLDVLKGIFSQDPITSDIIESNKPRFEDVVSIRGYDLGERRSTITIREKIQGKRENRTYEIKRSEGFITDVEITDTKTGRKFELKHVNGQCYAWNDSNWPDAHLNRCETKPTRGESCEEDKDWVAYIKAVKKPVPGTVPSSGKARGGRQ